MTPDIEFDELPDRPSTHWLPVQDGIPDEQVAIENAMYRRAAAEGTPSYKDVEAAQEKYFAARGITMWHGEINERACAIRAAQRGVRRSEVRSLGSVRYQRGGFGEPAIIWYGQTVCPYHEPAIIWRGQMVRPPVPQEE